MGCHAQREPVWHLCIPAFICCFHPPNKPVLVFRGQYSLWHKSGWCCRADITRQCYPAPLTPGAVSLCQLLSLPSLRAARWPGGRRCGEVGEQRPWSGCLPPGTRSLHVQEVEHQPQVGSRQIQRRRRRNRGWRKRNGKQRGKGQLAVNDWVAAVCMFPGSPGRSGGVQHAGDGDCQGEPEELSRAPERSSEIIPKLTAFSEFSLPKCGLELINHICLDPLMEYSFPKTYLLDWIRSSTGWDPRFSLLSVTLLNGRLIFFFW